MRFFKQIRERRSTDAQIAVEMETVVPRRIIDTNILYGLAARNISATKLKENVSIAITPTNLVELFRDLDNPHEFQVRQAAAQAAYDIVEEYLDPTDLMFAQVWNINAQGQAPSIVWKDYVTALAFARDVHELSTGVLRPNGKQRIRLDWKGIEKLRLRSYDAFRDDILASLEPVLPGYINRYKAGAFQAADAVHQDRIRMLMTGLLGHLTILTNTRKRAANAPVDSQPYTKQDLVLAADQLEAYCKVLGRYLLRRSISAPQPNDMGDLTCFMYVRPGDQVATCEILWQELADEVGMGHIIYKPVPRLLGQMPLEAHSRQQLAAYFHWQERGSPLNDEWFDWFGASILHWKKQRRGQN